MAAVALPTRKSGYGANRAFVVGSTGSGKTVFMVWLLSTASLMDWRREPVIIMDWKRERLLNSLGAKSWPVTRRPPTDPGLYIVKMTPPRTEAVDLFLDRVWENGNTGLLLDETTDYKGCHAIDRIYKQGRSLNIPCIAGAQRPTGVPVVIRSEAEYYSMFRLNDLEDRKEMRRYLGDVDVTRKLPKHHCIWYDTGEDIAVEMGPAPPPAQLRTRFIWAKSQAGLRQVV